MRKLLVAGLAFAGLMMMAAQPSQAMSLSSPGMANTAKYASESMVTEVRFGHGGRGFRRGRHFGGRHFGGFRGFRRPHFVYRRAWRPRRVFYAPAPRRCHVVWTYRGPVRVCRVARRWW